MDCDKSEKTFHKGDIITVTDRKSDGYRDIIEGRIGTMEVTLPETHVKPYDNNPGTIKLFCNLRKNERKRPVSLIFADLVINLDCFVLLFY